MLRILVQSKKMLYLCLVKIENNDNQIFNYFNIITMTKTELIAAVAERRKKKKKDAQEIVGNLFDILTENLKKDESTVILGFGTLAVQNKPERQGINPSNRQKITIPARKTVKFKASKTLLEKL